MKHLLTLFIVLTALGCSRDSGVSDTIVKSVYSGAVAENISSTLESHRFVVLDASTPQSLIGGMIGKIKKHGGRYYVSCDYKRLLIFDNDGGFKYEINRIGRGPGEYTMLADFDVRGETLAILDANKIDIYNSDNGAHIRTIPLDFTTSNIMILDDSHYCIYTSIHNIHLVDDSGAIVETTDLRATHLSRLHSRKPFIEYRDRIFFQIGYSNDLVVYNTKKKTFSSAILYADDNIMTANQEDEYIKLYGNRYERETTPIMIDGLASSDTQLMFGELNGDNTTTYIVANRSNNIIYSLSDKTINDITYTSPFLWDASVCDGGDSFITYLNPGRILEGIEKNSQYADQANYKWLTTNLVPRLSEDGNPVLLEFKFKSK